MPKKIVNDLIINKRSIRQIPLSTKSNPKVERSDFDYSEDTEVPKMRGNRKPLNPKFVIWLLAVICLVAVFFGVSLVFSSAKVIITPRTQEIIFDNDTFTAKLNTTASVADLTFEILKVKQTASETVAATAEKEVSKKSSGTIIVYNNHSTVSQRLINNTRFESANGKVYRINSSVVVPGQKTVDGKIVPGSIEATVFADQAGEDYNLRSEDLTGDFTIPGFKGSPQYPNFYARLKTNIVGGFVGKQKVVDETLRQATEDILKANLKEQLLKGLYAIMPDNYLLFDEGYSIKYSVLPDGVVDGNKSQINMEAEINGIVFNSLKLSKYLGLKKIADFDSLPTELIITDDLIVTMSGKDSNELWRNDSLSLKFNGPASIKWLYDTETIKKDLAGRKGTDLVSILSKYRESVSSVQVVFRPVWTRYFPDNLNKIKIEEIGLTK